MAKPSPTCEAVYEAIVKSSLSDYDVENRSRVLSNVVIQSLVIIVPIGALVLGMYYFQSKQMNAMKNRLREDTRDLENRLREDIRESEDRLRGEIKVVAESVETAKSELRAEIKVVAESVETAKSELRAEIKVVAESVETAKSELRAEIVAAEERLRAEIKVVAESVKKGDADLSHRMDRNYDKISRLIQDVGVVQGAVLGVSVEAVPREQPAGTN
jgi:CRISPR/Cas system-associated protein Csm6